MLIQGRRRNRICRICRQAVGARVLQCFLIVCALVCRGDGAGSGRRLASWNGRERNLPRWLTSALLRDVLTRRSLVLVDRIGSLLSRRGVLGLVSMPLERLFACHGARRAAKRSFRYQARSEPRSRGQKVCPPTSECEISRFLSGNGSGGSERDVGDADNPETHNSFPFLKRRGWWYTLPRFRCRATRVEGKSNIAIRSKFEPDPWGERTNDGGWARNLLSLSVTGRSSVSDHNCGEPRSVTMPTSSKLRALTLRRTDVRLGRTPAVGRGRRRWMRCSKGSRSAAAGGRDRLESIVTRSSRQGNAGLTERQRQCRKAGSEHSESETSATVFFSRSRPLVPSARRLPQGRCASPRRDRAPRIHGVFARGRPLCETSATHSPAGTDVCNCTRKRGSWHAHL